MIIEDFRGDNCEISEENIINILKVIYNGINSNEVYYIGASLCYTHPVKNHPRNLTEFLFVFQPNNKLTEEIDYWVSKLYIQNKTEDAHYWNVASEIVSSFESKEN